MQDLRDKIAVITGAAAGIGLELARAAHRQGMKLVLADVQPDALERTRAEFESAGAQVFAQRTDVGSSEQMRALADATLERFGAPHLLFNNAGIAATGGLLWEAPPRDWEWALGVNLWGVIHGVRLFTPLMLAAARADPGYRGHVVNTASMAGLLTSPTLGVYATTKHAVVALSEVLYHDLQLVTEQVGCSVLCPSFVPTGIFAAERPGPADPEGGATPTASQHIAREMGLQATGSGTVGAPDVARLAFEAIVQRRFYIYPHPERLAQVARRMEAILKAEDPPDPLAARPELGQALRARLRAPA